MFPDLTGSKLSGGDGGAAGGGYADVRTGFTVGNFNGGCSGCNKIMWAGLALAAVAGWWFWTHRK